MLFSCLHNALFILTYTPRNMAGTSFVFFFFQRRRLSSDDWALLPSPSSYGLEVSYACDQVFKEGLQ